MILGPFNETKAVYPASLTLIEPGSEKSIKYQVRSILTSLLQG
jgi:hypothetical protein